MRITTRSTGKTNALILSIIPALKKGERIRIAGCKHPEDIIKRLKAHGVNAVSEPMTVTQPIKAIYDNEGIIGFENGKKAQTGFIFYAQETKTNLLGNNESN